MILKPQFRFLRGKWCAGLLMACFLSLATFLSLVSTVVAQDAAETRMSPELLWKLGRVGEAVVSPDGTSIAYGVRRYELAENKGNSTLMLINVADGSENQVLGAWPGIEALQWVGEGESAKLFFAAVDPEDADAGSQVFVFTRGQEKPVKISSIDGGVANLKGAPTGKHIAYTADVKMDETVNEVYPDLPKADARIIDQLMFRHWNAWHDFAYSHLHVAPIGGDGMVGESVDLMEGMKADCPVPPFAGSEHFNWSPEGTEIALTTKISERMAESTDSDVYLVQVNDPKSLKCITEGQDGYDNDPVYSPDGKYLA